MSTTWKKIYAVCVGGICIRFYRNLQRTFYHGRSAAGSEGYVGRVRGIGCLYIDHYDIDWKYDGKGMCLF